MSYVSPLAKLYPEKTTYMPVGKAEVPALFSSVEEEYAALREKTGLLDYSHLGRIAVSGDGALEFLQERVTRDIEYLMPERTLSSLILNEQAHPVDMVSVYNLEDRFMIETSPGKAEEVFALLRSAAPDGITVEDLSEQQAVIGLEGPYAWQVLGKVVDFEVSILPFQGVMQAQWQGETVIISRTGFTAEYGYKIYAQPEVAARIWEELQAETTPVGYQVLEIVMLEVRQPVLHRELSHDGTVIRCGLNWLVDLQKENFTGKDALQAQREAGEDYLTIGFVADAQVQLPAGATVRAAEVEVGRVVHTVYSPGLGKVLGLIRMEADWTASGLELNARNAAGNWQPIMTISSPYLTPKSWSIPIL